MKESLHKIRKTLDDLFYYSFDNLTGSQRKAFQNAIDEIDRQIKAFEHF